MADDELITGEFKAGDAGIRIEGPLSPPPDPLRATLTLILDVLRANDLHQEHCEKRQIDEANRSGDGPYWYPKPCNCWLSEAG